MKNANEISATLVSAIIPAYNSERFIARAIESILKQDYRHFEIIVVDDGSTDRTGEIVQSIEGPIVYLRQENSGPSVARNRGIENSRGEYIAFLDADDEWLPERLKKTLEPMLKNPRVGLSYCYCLRLFPDGSQEIEHARSVIHRQKGGVYPPPYIQTSSATIRRECFERCGLFDPALKFFEDIDLFIRIAEEYEHSFLEEPLVHIHAHEDSYSRIKDSNVSAEMALRLTLKALVRRKIDYDYQLALSAAFLEAGMQHFAALRNREARRFYQASFGLQPGWRSFQFILRTLIPGGVTKTVRSLRDLAERRSRKP